VQFIRNINLAWKFSIFAGLATLLLLTAMLISYRGMKGTNERFDRFSDKYQELALTVSQMHTQGVQAEQAVRNVILNPSDEKALSNFKKASDEFLGLLKEAAKIAEGVREYSGQFNKLPAMWQENNVIKEEIIKLAREGKQAESIEMLIKKETPKWREIKALIIEMQSALKKDMKSERTDLAAFTRKTFSMSVTALLATILLIDILLLLFWRVMQTSFNELLGRLRDIAAGEADLSRRLEVNGKDEFSAVNLQFNRFVETLEALISHAALTAVNVATSAGSIQAYTQEMRNMVEDAATQAASVATASEEMSATSDDIARNCSMAADSSQYSNKLATEGASVIQATVVGMTRIAERVKSTAIVIENLGSKSDQIGAIVGTIEDIADQTNLLALNAAIEAARAGEQGRGFAVVADEVRALAERTTRATKEIGEMIKSIQKETKIAVESMEAGVSEVARGTEEAARSGEALQGILQQIGEVTQQINQIATAAEEQTATTSDISANIHKITDVFTKTSQTAYDTSNEADALNKLSAELQETVSRFKTKESDILMLTVAANDHRLFVNKIRSAVIGDIILEAQTLPSHHTCRFGKWYDSEGKRICGNLGTFKAIELPHERIHTLCREAVAAANSGEHGKAKSIMQDVDNVSRTIMTGLEDTRREYLRG